MQNQNNNQDIKKAAIDLENKRLADKYEKLLLANDHNSIKKSNRMIVWITATILCFALIFASYKFLISPNSAKKKASNYIAEVEFYSDPINSSRGTASQSDTQIAEAEKLLLQNNIDQAIKLFEEIDPELLSPIQNMNLALAYIKNKQHQKASDKFDFINQKQSNFIQEIQYLEVLNMIELGQIDEAKPLMKNIIDKKQYKWKEVNALMYTLQ